MIMKGQGLDLMRDTCTSINRFKFEIVISFTLWKIVLLIRTTDGGPMISYSVIPPHSFLKTTLHRATTLPKCNPILVSNKCLRYLTQERLNLTVLYFLSQLDIVLALRGIHVASATKHRLGI
jgi:hypothetical protein